MEVILTRSPQLEKILHNYIEQKQPLLLAITSELTPRLLTSTDDKRYLVLFSSLEEVHKEDTSTSLLAENVSNVLHYAAESNLDGMVINPWDKRITVPKQEVRHIYYQYIVKQYTQNKWWNSPLLSEDYELIMWDKSEPYDEEWITELLRKQEPVKNIAWWAKEQPKQYQNTPVFVQIWLAFYGLYWLQSIFTVGLNTLYYKELDEAGLYLAIFLTIGLFLIFKYINRFNNWWEAREKKAQALREAPILKAQADEAAKQEQLAQEQLLIKREKERLKEYEALAVLEKDIKCN